MAGTRNRLGELSGASLASGTSQNFGMQSIGPSPPYSGAWGNNMWSSPSGSGIKSSPDSNRAAGKPAPLSKTTMSTDQGGAAQPNPMDGSEKLSGPSSLLSSSESEGWNGRRHWPSMSGISAGLNNARNGNTDTSPVRQRANQQTRSNSPFYQHSTIGSGATNKSGQSLLDPTSRSFNSSGLFNLYQPSAIQTGDSDDGNRLNLNSSYDSVASNNMIPSGFNSNAASRSGSLPPSRHGNDYPPQFGEYPTNLAHSNIPDAFGQRANQHSRNSTISANGPERFSDTPWQSNVGDLTALMGRMNTGRDALEESLSSLWGDQSNQLQSPNRAFGAMSAGFNGPPNGEFFTNQRSNSISYDTDARLFPPVAPSFNQQRIPFPDRSSNSPTGSDARRSRGSPQYLNTSTPPLPDHSRGFSNVSGRSNLNPHNLDRKLQRLQDQQSYAPSPAMSFRPPYLGAYDVNAQNNQRINQQLQYYQSTLGVGMPYGVQQPPFNVPNQPLRPHQPGQMLREPPRGPAGDSIGDSLRSSLLEEFRATKGTKKYDLKDIYNHVVEFSGDQHGSRFIQQKLETANSDEKAQLFAEILPNALQLMTDVFGNYVIQKFFEHGNQTQKKQLADKLRGHVAEFSLQMYGCRVVQKAFEHILTDQQASLVKELESQVLKCVKDQNGNHVIQKAIQRIPAENISFIINAFTNQVQHLATHPYGCRVVQRMLEHCQDPVKTNILEELHLCAEHLIVDQYGNYVTQHVIVHGRPEDRLKIISIITSQLVMYSRHKFASNVVEKSIEHGSDEQRRRIVEIISTVDERGIGPMHELIKDQYGNYVIQKLLKLLQGAEHEAFISSLKPQIARIKQFSYAKQIGQIERLVSLGPAPTLTDPQPSNFSPPDNSRHPCNAQGGSASDKNQNPHLPNAPVDLSVAPTPPLVNEDAQSPPSSSQPSTNNSTVDGPIGKKGDGAGLKVEDADA